MSNLEILDQWKNRKNNYDSLNSQDIRFLSTRGDFLNFLLIWILFTSAAPFTFIFAVPNHPHKILIAGGLALTSFLLVIKGRIILPNRTMVGILIAQAFFFVFPLSFLHGEFHQGSYITISIQYIAILLLYIYVYNFYSIHKMAKSFIYVITLMAIMGTAAFFLGIVGAIDIFSTHQNLDTRTAYNFLLTFSNSINHVGRAIIIRVAGFFDEPGTFAYYITFALLINKIYDFSKKLEWILIIGGIFTLSMAFYITLSVYLIIFYGNFKRLKYFLLGSIIITSLGFYVNTAKYDSETNFTLYRLTIQRFERDESSSERLTAGDNRSELFSLAAEAFMDSPLIGQGHRYREDISSKYYNIYMGDNLFAPLAIYGIVGTLVSFLGVFYWTYLVFSQSNTVHRNLLISCWLIMALNFLQRPHPIGFLNYYVIIFLVDSTKYRLKN